MSQVEQPAQRPARRRKKASPDQGPPQPVRKGTRERIPKGPPLSPMIENQPKPKERSRARTNTNRQDALPPRPMSMPSQHGSRKLQSDPVLVSEVRNYMKMHKLSQVTVGQEARISQAVISQWLSLKYHGHNDKVRLQLTRASTVRVPILMACGLPAGGCRDDGMAEDPEGRHRGHSKPERPNVGAPAVARHHRRREAGDEAAQDAEQRPGRQREENEERSPGSSGACGSGRVRDALPSLPFRPRDIRR